jgi:hypothetical protein
MSEGVTMKTFLVIAFFPALAFCQGFLPRWELSLAADVNSVSSRNQYVFLQGRAGFYPLVGEGLSIEPELTFGRTNETVDYNGASYGKTNPVNAYNISGNISYGYGMGYWPAVPFVLIGYGVGDGVPFYQPMSEETNLKSKTAVSVLNMGAGVKIMTLGGRGLFRLEYRYQAFTESLYRGGNRHVFGRRILLGVSVLL